MKALEEKILQEGKILPGEILKVGSFLNQRVDTGFLMEMAREVVRRFKDETIDKVLTVEASGIPYAFAIAVTLGVPLVFAKKSTAQNVGTDIYSANVHSYTHNRDNQIVVSKEYLLKNERILIADDFLACGNAFRGLIELVNAAGATVVGCTSPIEKGYQGGGDSLRKEGIRVESLAIIDSMSDDSIVFRK